MALRIVVQDERGKIPLNLMDDGQVRDMFERLGLAGERLNIATDSFLDWRDDDDERRPNGAEGEDYAAAGVRPRNGPLRSRGELAMIRGIDAALVERLAPVATVYFGDGSFEPRFAQPFALEVMGEGDGPTAIERARELAGQRPAIELGDDMPLTGRPLRIAVDSFGSAGSHARRSAIIELSGSSLRPYVVLDYE
jgi:general secretion pathway protein K